MPSQTADARYGVAGGFALEGRGTTLPDGDVTGFRVGANGRRHQYLDRVHQIPVVVVTDLAIVIPGVLRANVFNLQTVALEQLEPCVAGNDKIGGRYDGTPSTPEQDVTAYRFPWPKICPLVVVVCLAPTPKMQHSEETHAPLT
uniref:Uncharacterized protein n=1 Tax=Anopheles maculatus TaxID=74869 RepID=A0A182SH72_9DIPT